MATPPNANANPAQNAPAAGSTTLTGGGQNAPATPSGPYRKVTVTLVASRQEIHVVGTHSQTLLIHDVTTSVRDRSGNPVTDVVTVAISGISGARQVTATNGSFAETVPVPAGASGVVYRATLHGETDSKELPAPPAPTQHHHATVPEQLESFMGSYGWKAAFAVSFLIALAFFASAFFGPYGLDWGESEFRKFALCVIFVFAAIALGFKAFGGGHAPSGGGH